MPYISDASKYLETFNFVDYWKMNFMNEKCYAPLWPNKRQHNEDERHSSLEKYTLTLFERVVRERELETEQNCKILTPSL